VPFLLVVILAPILFALLELEERGGVLNFNNDPIELGQLGQDLEPGIVENVPKDSG
jgi:hypothetical protein